MKNLFSRAMGSCVWGVLPAVLAGCFEVPKWAASSVASEPGGAATGAGLCCEQYEEPGAANVGTGNMNVNVTGDSNVTNVDVYVESYGYGGGYYYYPPYYYASPGSWYGGYYYPHGYPYYWAPVVSAVPAVPAQTPGPACDSREVQRAPRSDGRLTARAGAALVQAYRASEGVSLSRIEVRASSSDPEGTRLGLFRGGRNPGEGELIASLHRPDHVEEEGEVMVFDLPELPSVERGESVFVVLSNPYALLTVMAGKGKRVGAVLEASDLWRELGDKVVKERAYREIAAVLRFESDCHGPSDTVAGL